MSLVSNIRRGIATAYSTGRQNPLPSSVGFILVSNNLKQLAHSFQISRIVGRLFSEDIPIKNTNFLKIGGQPDWYPENLHITIDDGPVLKRLEDILGVLDKHGVKATFFFDGSRIDRYRRDPEQFDSLKKLFKRMEASGHRIGYHCYYHCHNEEATDGIPECKKRIFLRYSEKRLKNDYDRFLAAVRKVFGKNYKVEFGRPPGGNGKYGTRLKKMYEDMGLNLVGWDFHDMPGEKGKKSRFRRIMESDPMMATFASGIREKSANGERIIILLHEKPDRDKFLDKFLTGLKENK